MKKKVMEVGVNYYLKYYMKIANSKGPKNDDNSSIMFNYKGT